MRFLTAIARVFWKELFELYQKPLILLAIVAISLLFVWTSGQINLRQAEAVVYLYKGGADDDSLNNVRTILKDFAHIHPLEMEGNLVDANSMQAAGASLAIVFRDGKWLLLHRFATSRQEDAASPVTGLLAYALQANQPLSALPLNPGQPLLRVLLYKAGADEESLSNISSTLRAFSNITVVEKDDKAVDVNELKKDGLSLAIIRSGDDWFFVQGIGPTPLSEEADRTVGLLRYLLRPDATPLDAQARARFLNPSRADSLSISRMSALPGEPQLELVPRTIALMVAFLPFVLMARSYSREVAFGTLPILLSLPCSGWGTMAAGKIAACTWIVMVVLLVILLAVHFLFGFNPKPGLIVQLAVQMVVIFISACLGLLFATLARNQSHVYLFTAVYFLVLVLVSGFLFSLETAASFVQLASHISPLTFSGKILEDWLFFGTSAFAFMPNVSFLLAQALIAAVLLTFSISFARRRV